MFKTYSQYDNFKSTAEQRLNASDLSYGKTYRELQKMVKNFYPTLDVRVNRETLLLALASAI
jgi:hypothetical protein